MAYHRKPLTARHCQQCGDPYHAVDRRRLYCCPGCKTAASQARRPSTAARAQRPLPDPALPLVPETALAAPLAGPGHPSFGKLVVATATGNLLADAVKSFWKPTAAAGAAPASGWPTWPPAELTAATGPPVRLTDPSWPTPQLLTPVTYHRHQLYLCVEQGLTVVLRQLGPGNWHYVRTPAQLAQLAAQPPVAPGMQALIAKYSSSFELPPSAPPLAPTQADETPQ